MLDILELEYIEEQLIRTRNEIEQKMGILAEKVEILQIYVSQIRERKQAEQKKLDEWADRQAERHLQEVG